MERRSFLITQAALATSLTGCGALPRLQAVPPRDEPDIATVLGMRDIRYWGDTDSPELIAEGKAAYDRELAAYREDGGTGPLPPASYLAISGGGENGAFGAGLLVGWTEAGTRPEFKLVTGISTGALTAPFAFLGPRYDPQLRAIYTQISAKDVLVRRNVLAAVTSDAFSSNAPLRRTIGRYVTPAMLDEIANAYRRGRLLLIGTTNLDQGRPVIWNIGKLAASGRPGVLHLVQQILIASAAIPGAFPPEMIDVEVDGRTYQEMHVDGGASAQVFVYPPSLQLQVEARRHGITRVRRLYVIRNARLDPDWEEIQRSTLSIAGRAISSLIQTQGVGDLYRIYVAASRDDIDFNLAYIPETFTMELKQPFDQGYMRALFTVGYDMGRKGYPWAKVPPGYRDLGAGPTLTNSSM
ncbi:MAG: patatin-like phospholipase family protein [Acetobacteraceae bacterium]|nr:patatin-like phospholipase family protein [Acetobacteraceae bacterium]